MVRFVAMGPPDDVGWGDRAKVNGILGIVGQGQQALNDRVVAGPTEAPMDGKRAFH